MIVIGGQAKIDDAMKRLAHRLEDEGEFMGEKEIPYKGGSEIASLYWFEKHRLWWAYAKDPHKYWNPFGIADGEWELDPKPSAPVCEINFPIDDPGSGIAGGFVREGKDPPYVAHSGRVGGGRPGIGPESFRTYAADKLDWWPCGWYNGDVVKVARISLLDAEDLVVNIAEFVAVVDEFKRAVV